MSSQPVRSRVPLPEISSRAWEHPADKGALVALRRLKGFDTLIRKISGLFNERAYRLQFLGSAIRVDERQFTRVHTLLVEVATALDADAVPELYVAANPHPSAVTLGMDKAFVVVTSGMVDLLDEEELRFVLGHEMGHVLSGHAVYQTMLQRLIRLSGVLTAIPIGGLGIRAITAALMEWSRKAELSADRAGLLATQDTAVAFRTLMKLASGGHLDDLDPTSFFAQGAEYDATGDLRDSLVKLMLIEAQSHPFTVVRGTELPLGGLGRLHAGARRRLPAPRDRRRREGQRGRAGGGPQLRRDLPAEQRRHHQAGPGRLRHVRGHARLGRWAVRQRRPHGHRGLASPPWRRPTGCG
jgi:Zn-dependent protease with chaperone function